jgi:environmental stress-induced protein Ves
MMHESYGTLVARDAQRPGVWGGGTTAAIYADPPEALGAIASARAWVGTAAIERDADYSYLPGLTRLHMPIVGGGIRLRFGEPDELVELPNLAQHRFDGARPLHAELVDGPITAFNLLVRHDVVASLSVVVSDHPRTALPWPADDPGAGALLRIVYAVGAALQLQHAQRPTTMLEAGDALVIAPTAELLAHPILLGPLAPGAALVVADLRIP